MSFLLLLLRQQSTFVGYSAVVLCVCSGCLQQTEVVVCLASLPAALLHRPQLLQTTLGELLHALLCRLHPVDRRLLLHHGLDGETRPFSINIMHIGPLRGTC